MSLNVSHCVPEDARGLAEAYLASFRPSPRFHATYHLIPDETLLKKFEEDFKKEIGSQNRPNATQEVHLLKVNDPSTSEIIAFAIWKYLPHGYRAEEDSDIQVNEQPEGTDVPLLRRVYGTTGKLRSKHPGRHEAHWLLSLLGTHPQHERRGAGRLLIRWPFAQADKDGKRCYVDASPIGYGLYKTCGFEQEVGEMKINIDEYAPQFGYGTVRWVALLREPHVV